jgi:uncharacterized protein YeaO (DUF488 family)
MAVQLKRVYEKPSLADGTRVLVDRLWPRGLSKNAARVDAWLRDLAPSDELRKWFHARWPEGWPVFRKRYLQELSKPQAAAAVEQLYEFARTGKLTLLYSSKNETQNNATVLKELLEGMRKPPSSSGPAKATATVRRMARRRP